MVFGEIVEPSSRALWGDFDEETLVNDPNLNTNSTELEWQGCLQSPNAPIEKIFVGESNCITTLLQSTMLGGEEPICRLSEAGISIFQVETDSFLITYTAKSNIPVGEITQKLTPWLQAARIIYILTSSPSTLFRTDSVTPKYTPPCFVRCLSNIKGDHDSYVKLEIPNLVTGLSASVFSYCLHANLNSALFVGFCEQVPLDSKGAQPLLELLTLLGAPLKGPYIPERKITPTDNLYT